MNSRFFILSFTILAFLITGCGSDKKEETSKTPSETVTETVGEDGVKLSNDASGFVLLSEAVPDAILEIRYYSTYNFVGDRIDGYEEPVALQRPPARGLPPQAPAGAEEKGGRFRDSPLPPPGRSAA